MFDTGHHSGQHSWHARAARAGFIPFEPVSARLRATWAGGFGGVPDDTAGHLEIVALYDRSYVSVDTIRQQRHPRAPTQRSMLVHRLVTTHTIEQTSVQLPYTLTVVSDDRTIPVSGQPVTFVGGRIDGTSRWIGEADLDHLLVRVELPEPIDLELRPCHDVAALADHPPQGVEDT